MTSCRVELGPVPSFPFALNVKLYLTLNCRSVSDALSALGASWTSLSVESELIPLYLNLYPSIGACLLDKGISSQESRTDEYVIAEEANCSGGLVIAEKEYLRYSINAKILIETYRLHCTKNNVWSCTPRNSSIENLGSLPLCTQSW